MKKFAKGIAICVVLGLCMTLAFCGVLVKVVDDQSDDCETTETSSSDSAADTRGLTVKDIPIEAAQARNATIIVDEAIKNDLPVQAAIIGIMTATQESTLRNLTYGYPGSSSVGLFQQISAWGPYSVRHNPRKSAHMFYFGGQQGQNGLTDISGWEDMELGDAAQSVQLSGFPDAYAQHERESTEIVAAITGSIITTGTEEDCEEELDPIEVMVRAALSHQGDDYEWDDAEGAGLVSSAAAEAGITLPDNMDDLQGYKGNEDEGVTVELVDPSDITSDRSLKRGDIVVYKSDDGSTHVGIELGVGSSGDHRIATYNVLGSNHTSASSTARRIKRSAEIILERKLGVVGLQEFHRDQWHALFGKKGNNGLIGASYDVFPAIPTWGKTQKSVNSIMWDSSKYELVSGEFTPMPFYFGGKKLPIPLIKLRVIGTNVEFYVVNTHDPTKNNLKRLRFLNALEHKRLVIELDQEGIPVFFTGDFNSGPTPRRTGGNTTYNSPDDERSLRESVTPCIMAESGVILDSYNALKGRTEPCPIETSRELGRGPIDHVFVPLDATVTHHVVIRGNTGSDHPVIYADVILGSQVPVGKGSKWQSVAVSRDGDIVDLVQFDTRDIVTVLRLTVIPPDVDVVSKNGWLFPLNPGVSRYSDSYGLSGGRFHNGADFGTSGATPPVHAMHGGELLRAEYDGGWGNYVMVETGVRVPGTPGNTYKYLFAHFSSFAPGLRVGDQVRAGQLLGNVGDTGNSFGEHLHMTICTDMRCTAGSGAGSAGSIDPIPFMEGLEIWPQKVVTRRG